MTPNGQAVAVTPADTVRDRLDDPQVAAALNTLLDHADVLAILVSGLPFSSRSNAERDASQR